MLTPLATADEERIHDRPFSFTHSQSYVDSVFTTWSGRGGSPWTATPSEGREEVESRWAVLRALTSAARGAHCNNSWFPSQDKPFY